MTINEYLNGLKREGFTPNGVLDIGANVGDFSRFINRLWETNILMIEGNDNCEEDLKRTNLPYIISLLGDENKKVDFFINKENDKCTGSSYYREITRHYDDCIVEEKQVIRLDDLVKDNFDIIKIDTQGSELDIIRGGLNIIQNSKFIILEVATKQYNQGSPLFDEVVSFMSSIGFNDYDVIENHIWGGDDYGEFKRNDIFQVDIAFKKEVSK